MGMDKALWFSFGVGAAILLIGICHGNYGAIALAV
jgi:hypothetical protein